MKFTIGKIINNLGVEQKNDLNFLDKFLLKHFVCFGGSGSGKTYLLKKLIEEITLKKIPGIIIDTQGDFSSLNILNKNNSNSNDWNDVEVRIFTPLRNNGIELSFSPFFKIDCEYDNSELVNVISNCSDSFTNLLGYNIYSEDGKTTSACLYLVFEYFYNNKKEINFDSLIDFFSKSNDLSLKINEFLSAAKLVQLIKRIKLLNIGKNKLIYDGKIKFDLDILFKRPALNIINITGIENEDVRFNIINLIISNLYNWMIKNPSNKLSSFLVIDEISSYIPAGVKKPFTKDLLQLLFKQARKYGVSCLIATQNPGDIDYKALSQFSTWSIGRLNTKQDFKKIESAINSVNSNFNFSTELPSLKTGEFLLYSPDAFDNCVLFKTNELLTEHKTISLKNIKNDELTIKKIELDFNSKNNLDDDIINTNNGNSKTDSENLVKGFPINVEEKDLSNLIKKNKKRFLMFFSELEQVEKIELKYFPIYYCSLKIKESKFLGLSHSISEYNVFFDAENLNPLQFNHFDFESINGFNNFINLNDDEIKIFKEIFLNKKITPAEISLKLDLSNRIISDCINNLVENNIIIKKNDGKLKLFSLMVDINIPFKLKKFSAMEDYSFYNMSINKKEINNIDRLKSILNIWFCDCTIQNSQLVYMPYYNIILSDKKNTRSLKINASSGNIINF